MQDREIREKLHFAQVHSPFAAVSHSSAAAAAGPFVRCPAFTTPGAPVAVPWVSLSSRGSPLHVHACAAGQRRAAA